MPFTAEQLANIANAALDHIVRGPALSQTIQDKPLYKALRAKQKTFGGGKGDISIPVKGTYTTDIQAFTHDQIVGYANPANIKRLKFPWREIHAGISLTLTELKIDGISVVDSNRSERTVEHSQAEITRLTGILDDKLEDMREGWARGFDRMLHEDGSQDPLEVPGLKALVPDNPLSGTVGGMNLATTSWFRNRAATAAYGGAGGQGAVTSNVANGGALIEFIHKEMRQLRRYGGRPNFAPAGSDFLDALAKELRANGNYSDRGWSQSGSTDISMADIRYKDLTFEYDPTLDDMGHAKRCYILDTRHIKLWTMEGEDMKQHTPSRPANQYVMYRAMTWTGGLCVDQLNAQGVYDIS